MFKFILFILLISGPQIVFLPFILFFSLIFQKYDKDENIVLTENKCDIQFAKKPIYFSSQQTLAKRLQLIQDDNAGIEQLGMLKKKTKDFKQIVSEKNDIDEITLLQYLNTVDQVYQSAYDNLKQYYLILKGVEAIDYHYLKKILLKQDAQEELNSEAIQQRLDLWQTQNKLADDFLILNEIELTKIDLLTAQVVNLNSQKTEAGGIENMIKTLDELSPKPMV